jgi:hypothetical protein
MSDLNNSLLLGQEGGGGYSISRSVRLNAPDSAFFSRTPASAGNRKTWTWAGWVKRSELTATNNLLSDMNAANSSGLYSGFNGGTFFFEEYALSGGAALSALAVFRDPSAWYHMIIAYDTTQATASNRFKLYVNGAQAALTGSYPNQNLDGFWNRAVFSAIGRQGAYNGNYFNGYLADIHFIDGQALDPTSFGEFDANGIWQPKAYSGAYGTNGFHLDFADNSTAAALGTDSSGAGNTWTVNNISVGGITYSSATNGNTPVYDIQIGPTNDLSGTYVWSNAFDANGSTIGLIGPITFINTKPTWSTSAGVQVMAAGNGITATVNGGSQVACTNGGWTTISTGSSGTLDSIWVYGATGASYFYGVRVDGVEIAVRRQINDNVNNDSLVDVPTNGSEVDTGSGGQVRGNYATFNNLLNTSGSYANGNLERTQSDNFGAISTICPSSGKWYAEFTYTAIGSAGVGAIVTNLLSSSGANGLGQTWQLGSDHRGFLYNAGSSTSVTSYTTNDVIGLAFDCGTGAASFYKNGTLLGTITNSAFANVPVGIGSATGGAAGSNTVVANYGARSFAYTAPSGFKALCTANLPAPVVTKPSTVMDVALYTGTSSTQTITLSGGFSPDLVWIKQRNGGTDHALFDVIRGSTAALQSSTTAAEQNLGSGNSVTLGSSGFTLGADTAGWTNYSTRFYAAWCFDAGSSTVTNTQGSITSSVRTNNYLSIVTYTGTGANATVGHGLGVAPQMIIVKSRGSVTNWGVGHTSIGWANALRLNTTDASSAQATFWNSTAPTSTVFSIGTGPSTNNNGDSIVAYCFAPVAGYSAFGSYTGNGSTDGPFVYTGFRPRWVLIKTSTLAGWGWVMYDTARNTSNIVNAELYAHSNNQEVTADRLDILSNGFKLRATSSYLNGSSETYVWAAFAESPFQYARAR